MGVGKAQVVVECAPVASPTSATLTTEAPCDDVYSNCGEMAQTSCYRDDIQTNCPKSCGLCTGMTPARSYTCYDQFSNCPQLCSSAEYANNQCKKACGKC